MRTLALPVEDNLIAMLKYYEHIHNGHITNDEISPQMDAVGIWTEGYGKVVRDENHHEIRSALGEPNTENAIKYRTLKTKADALVDLRKHVQNLYNALDVLTKGKLNDAQLAAVTSFTYNVGLGGLKSSSIYRLIQADKIEEIVEHNFTDWNKGDKIDFHTGKLIILPGLIVRRTSEWTMFHSGILSFFAMLSGVVIKIEVN